MSSAVPVSFHSKVWDLLQRIEISPESETFQRQALIDELKAVLLEAARRWGDPGSLDAAAAMADELETHPKFTAEWKDLFARLSLTLTNHPSLVDAPKSPSPEAHPPV